MDNKIESKSFEEASNIEEKDAVLKEFERTLKEMDELENSYNELKKQPNVVISEDLQRFMEGK